VTFTNILRNPVIGTHNPLRLGWSDEQLWPVVERLQAVLDTSDLNDNHMLATASVAMSLVMEMKYTDGGLRYARRKDVYNIPKRYRCGDPLFTWHYITRAMRMLERHGLITCAPGISCPGGGGFQSVAWASELLVGLLEPVVSMPAQRGIPARVETIVLRDGSDKHNADYVDTAETIRMRDEVATVNERLAELDIYHLGEKVTLPRGRRVFNDVFDRGGRFYLHGPSYQNCPAPDRRELSVVSDGAEYPMVEVDFANLHIQMAYAEARKGPLQAISTPSRGSTAVWSRSPSTRC
jgi:hypothetical protein